VVVAYARSEAVISRSENLLLSDPYTWNVQPDATSIRVGMSYAPCYFSLHRYVKLKKSSSWKRNVSSLEADGRSATPRTYKIISYI
jgi:hypothetical protein